MVRAVLVRAVLVRAGVLGSHRIKCIAKEAIRVHATTTRMLIFPNSYQRLNISVLARRPPLPTSIDLPFGSLNSS